MLKILLALLLVAAAASACARSPAASQEPRESTSHVQPAGGASSASVRIEFGGGSLTVGALDDAQGTLSRMTYEGPPALQPQSSYQLRDGAGDLEYVIGDAHRRQNQYADMRVLLARDLPLALSVDAGGAQSTLDLTALRIARFELQAGASNTRVRLPEAAGPTVVNVEGGAARLVFDVPPEVAADVQVSGVLDTRSIDEARFRLLGSGRYRSPEYETATNRVELRLELGAANLTVR